MTSPSAASLPAGGVARPAGRGVLTVALVAAVLGAAATLRLWVDPAGLVVAGNVPDAMHYSWWLAHTPYALLHGQNPFVTTAMNWPAGVGTMNNTTLILPSLVLAPVTWLAGSLATLNVLTILSVPACIAAGYWALRQAAVVHDERGIGLSRPVALAGGVAFGISPAVVNSLVGHVTMAFAPGLPILMVLGAATWTSPRPLRAGLWLGLVAAAQVFIGEEVLFQAGLGSVIILVVAACSRPGQVPAAARRAVRALGLAAAIVLVICGYGLYQQFFGPLRQHGSPFLPGYYGADLTAFFTTSDRLLLHTSAGALATTTFPGGTEEHLAYLGVPLLVLCLVVAVTGWKRLPVRCAAAGLLLSMVLSLGSRIWIAGQQHTLRGPYALLEATPVAESSLATRLGLLAAVFAAALLAFGLHTLLSGPKGTGPVREVAAGLVALACLAPLLPVPLPVVAAPAVPAYFTTTARALPQHTLLVVLPYPTAIQPVAMRWQVAARFAFSMPGGYFLGPGPGGQAYVGGGADPVLAVILSRVAQTGLPAVITPQLRVQATQDLDTWDPSAIVLGPAPGADAVRTTLTGLLGAPAEQGGVWIWKNPAQLVHQ